MKKLLSFCMLLLLAMPANAWVFLNDAQAKTPGLLLPTIIKNQGQNVRVCIDPLTFDLESLFAGSPKSVLLYNTPDGSQEAKTYIKITMPFIAPAYQTWFDTLRSTIAQAKREKEFADVLALLPSQPLSFNFVNQDATPCQYSQGQDLYIRLDDPQAIARYGHSNMALAYTRIYDSFSAITLPLEGYRVPEQLKNILLHEAGHSFGLGDMYGDQASSSANDKTYTMAKLQQQSSIPACMNNNCGGKVVNNVNYASYTPNAPQRLTCDDMDGLVNLLDYYFPERMSDRRTQGWLSFCQDKNVAYVASLPLALDEQEKKAFTQFVKKGRQGVSPIMGKAETILKQAQDQAAAQVQAQNQQRMQQRQMQEQDALAAALANQKKEDEYKKKMAGFQALPDECPVCHKPLTGENPVRLCDRDENKKIASGCVLVHKSCVSAIGTKTALKEFIRNIDPKYVAHTDKAFIADN